MPLRRQTRSSRIAAPLGSRAKLRALGLAAAVALALGAGGAGASISDYASPLYLSKVASPTLAGSHQLLTSPGTSTPATPPTTAAAAGAGMPTGFYRYVYTVVDANGSETEPSPVSTPDVQTTAGMQNVLVGGLPTGVTVRVYRRRSTTILFLRVAELVDNASLTYLDSAADPPPGSIVLPQAQNRVAWVFMNPYSCMATNCGYEEFRPGVPVPNASTSFPTSPPAVSAAPSGNGWIVENSGDNLAFAPGNWTFRVQIKSGPMPTGTAHLAVGMWKVTPGGPTYSTALVDPSGSGEETSTNLIDTSNSFRQITHTVTVPAFTLAPGEHLYVQFWRRQAAPYQSASANDARVLTLAAQDGYSRVEHPGVSTLPSVPSLSAPADGASFTAGTPQLSGTFSDPDASDTGTLEFRVCSLLTGGAGSDCADLVTSGVSPSVANGATASWTVASPLSPGSYYWQARASDGIGTSAWSPTRALTVHVVPSQPPLVSPAGGAQVRTSSPTLQASYSDPDGNAGTVLFRVCRNPSVAGVPCSGKAAEGASPTVASGTTALWAVTPALPDRRYYWQARAEDENGATSGWSATRRLDVAEHLIRMLSIDRLRCSVGMRLPIVVQLAARSSVKAFFRTSGRVDLVRNFGSLAAGKRTLRTFLSYSLERPAVYWVEWRAVRAGETESVWTRIALKPLPASGVPYCRRA